MIWESTFPIDDIAARHQILTPNSQIWEVSLQFGVNILKLVLRFAIHHRRSHPTDDNPAVPIIDSPLPDEGRAIKSLFNGEVKLSFRFFTHFQIVVEGFLSWSVYVRKHIVIIPAILTMADVEALEVS